MYNLSFLYQKKHPIDLFVIFLGTITLIETKIFDSSRELINKMKVLHKDNKEGVNYYFLVVRSPKVITLHYGELLSSLPEAYQKYCAKLNIPVVNLQLSTNKHLEDQN